MRQIRDLRQLEPPLAIQRVVNLAAAICWFAQRKSQLGQLNR